MKKSGIFFLSVDNQKEQSICLLCDDMCQPTDNIELFTESYWKKLKSLAKEWPTQCIEKHESNYVFKSVYSRIHDKEAFGKVHSFLIKLARFYHFAKGGWRPTS